MDQTIQGATNVLRIGGRWSALAVLIIDILKGMTPVWVGYYLGLIQFELGMVALGACLGTFSPFSSNSKAAKASQPLSVRLHQFLGL